MFLLTGCIGPFADNSSSSNNEITAEVSIENNEVTLVNKGNADKVILKGSDGDIELNEGESVPVKPGGTIVASRGDDVSLIKKVTDEDIITESEGNSSSNNNSTNNSVSPPGRPGFNTTAPGNGTDPVIKDYSNVLNVSGSSELVPLGKDWFVVGANGHYTSLEIALENVPPKTNIVLTEGTYEGNLTIKKDIDIYGLDGAVIEGEGTGLRIKEDTKIHGLTFSGFERAIVATDTLRDEWVIENSIFKKVNTGIYVQDNVGNWSVQNSKFKDYNTGILVKNNWGEININKVHMLNSDGIAFSIFDPHNKVTVNNTRIDGVNNTISGELEDIDFGKIWVENDDIKATCDSPRCGGSIPENVVEENRFTKEKLEEKTFNDIHLVENKTELETARDNFEEGDIIYVHGNLNGIKIEEDLYIVGSDDASISGTEGGDADCVDIENDAEPVLYNIEISGCTIGIDASRTSGDWKIINSDIEVSSTAVLAIYTSGDWSILNSEITDSKVGVNAHTSSGKIRIISNEVTGHSSFGFVMSQVQNETAKYNAINENSKSIKTRGDGGIAVFDYNWWGEEGPDSVDGSVTSTNYRCAVRDCEDQIKLNEY